MGIWMPPACMRCTLQVAPEAGMACHGSLGEASVMIFRFLGIRLDVSHQMCVVQNML